MSFLKKLFGKKRLGPQSGYKDQILTLARVRNVIGDLGQGTNEEFLRFALHHAHASSSQIFQDLFVLHLCGLDHKGFFVEFGATNGRDLSNSYGLETHFGWQGICAEPARKWHGDFAVNRPNTILETRCVWRETGAKLAFSETDEGELSTLSSFKAGEGKRRRNQTVEEYEVETVSLNDMLTTHNAPEVFDYLSIDTEGSELDILSAFDFSKHRPKIITVEHNYTANRAKLYELLTGQGYRRILTDVSLFDDWYVLENAQLV